MGQKIFSLMDSHGGKAIRNLRWLTLSLAFTMLLFAIGTFITSRIVARPSRRMVNMSYVMWVLAECIFLLVVYTFVQAAWYLTL